MQPSFTPQHPLLTLKNRLIGLAADHGIDVEFFPDEDRERVGLLCSCGQYWLSVGGESFVGSLLQNDQGEPVIAVKKSLSAIDQCYVIGHELGHWFLDPEGHGLFDDMEKACAIFAVAVLAAYDDSFREDVEVPLNDLVNEHVAEWLQDRRLEPSAGI